MSGFDSRAASMKILIINDKDVTIFEQWFGNIYIDPESRREKKLTAKILIDKFEEWVIREFCGA